MPSGQHLAVDGGICRHDFIAPVVVEALMRVRLDTGVPALSMVLTPHHFHEHDEHPCYCCNHFVTKGEEAANAVVQAVVSLAALPA